MKNIYTHEYNLECVLLRHLKAPILQTPGSCFQLYLHRLTYWIGLFTENLTAIVLR